MMMKLSLHLHVLPKIVLNVVLFSLPGDVLSDGIIPMPFLSPFTRDKSVKLSQNITHRCTRRYDGDTDTCITFSNRSSRLQPRPPHDKVVVVTLVRRPHCVPTPFRADITTSPIVLNMSKTISEVCRSSRAPQVL